MSYYLFGHSLCKISVDIRENFMLEYLIGVCINLSVAEIKNHTVFCPVAYIIIF